MDFISCGFHGKLLTAGTPCVRRMVRMKVSTSLFMDIFVLEKMSEVQDLELISPVSAPLAQPPAHHSNISHNNNTHSNPSLKKNRNVRSSKQYNRAKMDKNKIKKRKRSRSSSKRKRKTERISSNSNISTHRNNHREKKSFHKKEKKKLPKIIPTNVGNIVGANSHTQVLEEPEEAYWEIEAIVDKRIMKKRVEYLVRWKGCPEDQNTWEPLDNLCDSAYREALRFSKDQKYKEQRRLDDEIRLGLFEGDSIPNTLKNTITILDEPSESEEEENFEMDAQIEIGEEEDDAWKWNDMEQLQFKPLERIDVNASNAREKVIEYRLNGTPFVLVNHVGWANFASRWLKKRDLSKDTGKDCNIIKLDRSSFPNSKTLEADSSSQSQLLQPLPTPPEKLDLSDPSLTLDVPTMLEDMGNEDVTVVRRNYNELSPIHGVIPVSKFLKVCWSKADKKEEVNGGTPLSSRIYLHQWQFPLSDTAGRKLGHQNVPLDSVLGEDLLCHWLDLPQCAGDNPLQYLFMGREDTHSKLHCDNGGLAITIAPIVGKKKCTLVHRLDGMSCLYHLNASLSKPNLNEYPLMANARIWQSVIEPGEILFMPAGTYHQCHNVTPCLSYSRFHLDDVNLVPFLRSFYDGDAKEIMHDEILWNACIGLMRKVEKIADDAGSGKGRKVTQLEFQTVTTLRKLRNIIKDVTRKSVIKDLIKGENTGGTVSDSHDWFKLVNDVDLCLHEFRYRKYGTDAPRFKPLSTSVLTNSQKNLVGSVNVSKANETVIAYDTELENSYMQLKFAPKKWEELCLSTINVDDLLDVKLCKKVVKARVLEILKNVKAAHLTYEDYPSIYDEWQYFDNLRSVKGDGADLKESDIKEGTVVLNRWGDMKSVSFCKV